MSSIFIRAHLLLLGSFLILPILSVFGHIMGIILLIPQVCSAVSFEAGCPVGAAFLIKPQHCLASLITEFSAAKLGVRGRSGKL